MGREKMAVGVTLPVPRLLKAPCQQGPHVKGSPTHSPWKPWSQCQGFSEQGPPLLPSSTYNSLAQDKPALNFCFVDSSLWKPLILVVLCVQWYLTIHIGLSLREAKRCLCHEEVVYQLPALWIWCVCICATFSNPFLHVKAHRLY